MLNELLDALAYAGETLDKPGAAVRGLAAGRPDQLLNLVPFSDTMGLTDPSQRVSGRDLLQQYGMLGQNTPGLDFGDVAGFAVEEGLDPTNWIPGGFLAKRAIRATGELPALTRMFGKTAPAVWSDDVAGMAARFADQEVDDIGADWLFDQRRLQAIPPAYQFKESGTTFAPEDVRDMLSEYNRAEYARRYGGAGTPVEPAELEPLYRALHARRLGRYRDWLGKNAVLDEAGNPLKLYHGTGEAFEEFSPNRFSSGAGGDLVGTGVYLSNDPDVSSSYAKIAAHNAYHETGDLVPANVRMQHVIGPVADIRTPAGIEAMHKMALQSPQASATGRAIPSAAHINANADLIRRKNLIHEMAYDVGGPLRVDSEEMLLSQNPDALGDVLGVDDVFPVLPEAETALFDLLNDLGRVPENGIEYAHWMKDYLARSPGLPPGQHAGSFDQILSGVTGIRHPGGVATGGRRHDAFVMFDPKNVVPVNPDPRMLQLLAERFRDPQGNLPFSILAALTGGAGAAAYRAGGQQDVY